MDPPGAGSDDREPPAEHQPGLREEPAEIASGLGAGAFARLIALASPRRRRQKVAGAQRLRSQTPSTGPADQEVAL